MIAATQPSRLRRLLAVLCASLVAVGVTVVLSATPAHAAVVYKGTFVIQTQAGLCVGIQNNSTARQSPIVLQNCDTSSGQRWAVYLATDQNNYWILAHGGAWPLNMCMDAHIPFGNPMWIWNCNGGNNQRFHPGHIGGSNPNFIMSVYAGDTNGQGTLSCVNQTGATVGSGLTVRGCGNFPFITGTLWTFVPA